MSTKLASKTVASASSNKEEKKYDIKQLLTTYKTKSAVIRYLASEGVSRGAIVKIFTDGGEKMIYQHVRNVLVQPLKKVEEKKEEVNITK